MKFLKIAAGVALTVGMAAFWYVHLSEIDELKMSTLRIVDRNGVLLQEKHYCQYGTAYPVDFHAVPRHFIQALLEAEDRRFYRHWGVDLTATARSFVLNARKGRIVAGGSTITQQLARNIRNRPRTLYNKIREAVQAVCFELRYSKTKILEEYLNRAPFGNGAYGVEAAAQLYFGKPIKDVTLAESAFLCAVPASNKLYNPYKRFTSVLKRQKRILTSLYTNNVINKQQYMSALRERLTLYTKQNTFRAPHFCGLVADRYTGYEGELKTVLDMQIQARVEYIIANHISKLSIANVNNASAVVIDNKTGEVLALVGSADFFDEQHHGQVNGAVALRQPGSAMKPFVYGLAFEHGMTPATVLRDIKSSFEIPDGGVFTPRNYDKEYHGMVRARTALACSYNIATVTVSERFGTDMLLAKLHEAGFKSLNKDASFYGPGLCLGSGEVTLIELARAYCGLANGGELRELKMTAMEPVGTLGRFFSERTAYLITDILSDNNARTPAFGAFSPVNLPFKCAVKTGTSKNFRDNWTVGYTPRYTVAVWVGNFDGKPMYSVSGISGAGPIFRDIMLALEVRNPDRDFAKPKGLTRQKVCAISGKTPTKYCGETISELFVAGNTPSVKCAIHRPIKTDKRNRLLASSDCPPEYLDEKVYAFYPSEYYEWTVNAGVPMPPLEISDLPGTGGHGEGAGECSVEFPRNGGVYKIDPVLRREYQEIPLKPKVANNVKQLKWRVDGREITADKYPFIVYWKLEKGTHVIDFVADAAGAFLKSNKIEITVMP